MLLVMFSPYLAVLLAVTLATTSVLPFGSIAEKAEEENDPVDNFTEEKREQEGNSKKILSPRSCLDHLKNGKNGGRDLIITTPSGQQKVYCDLRSEPGSAWTLVLSHRRKYSNNDNIEPFLKPLNMNLPVNEKTPNFYMYRMTHAQMSYLKNQSTHWRVTCNGAGVDYQDYLRAKFTDFDPLTFIGSAVCKKVELINVRNHVGIGVTAAFWQVTNKEILHHDSSAVACQFGSSPGYKPSEDNFGFYKSTNTQFRCTSYDSATSNIWFGGYQ